MQMIVDKINMIEDKEIIIIIIIEVIIFKLYIIIGCHNCG